MSPRGKLFLNRFEARLQVGFEGPLIAPRALATQRLVDGQTKIVAVNDPLKQVIDSLHPCRSLLPPIVDAGSPAPARHTSRCAHRLRPQSSPTPPGRRPALHHLGQLLVGEHRVDRHRFRLGQLLADLTQPGRKQQNPRGFTRGSILHLTAFLPQRELLPDSISHRCSNDFGRVQSDPRSARETPQESIQLRRHRPIVFHRNHEESIGHVACIHALYEFGGPKFFPIHHVSYLSPPAPPGSLRHRSAGLRPRLRRTADRAYASPAVQALAPVLNVRIERGPHGSPCSGTGSPEYT